MEKPDYIEATERYVDEIFGPGTGAKHLQFLDGIENAALREQVQRYHVLESDTSELSREENYLIGMCVLCATKNWSTVAMFAKTLLHLGVRKQKLLEATARLAMWIGGLPAVEASFVVQRAIREYERDGLESLRVWFPEPTRSLTGAGEGG
jgi:alkylhydroperoxidase/carboxymuconolactone decarboxylase family protein YurZ